MNKKQMRKDILAIRDSISKEDILKKSKVFKINNGTISEIL